MNKIFPKINLKFSSNVTKLINMFSCYITTHFIPNNKNYNSCCNPHSVYQTCLKYKLYLENIRHNFILFFQNQIEYFFQ